MTGSVMAVPPARSGISRCWMRGSPIWWSRSLAAADASHRQIPRRAVGRPSVQIAAGGGDAGVTEGRLNQMDRRAPVEATPHYIRGPSGRSKSALTHWYTMVVHNFDGLGVDPRPAL